MEKEPITVNGLKNLKSELDKVRLDQAVAYAENPTRIRKEIETAINEEISCLIDLLGTEINKQILDPAGIPPSARQLVKNELPNPMTFKFGRTPNFQNVLLCECLVEFYLRSMGMTDRHQTLSPHHN